MLYCASSVYKTSLNSLYKILTEKRDKRANIGMEDFQTSISIYRMI